MVEQRLEDGEVADVLIAQRDLEFLHFIRDVFHPCAELDDLLRDLPVDRLDLRLALQLQQAEVEHRLRLFLDLLRVVQRLHAILPREIALQIEDVDRAAWDRSPTARIAIGALVLFDRAKGLDDEHGMMRHDRASAFADDRRVRHFLGVADLHDVLDDVARVFVERVVRRAVEGRARAVVVHAEAAAAHRDSRARGPSSRSSRKTAPPRAPPV